MSTKTGGGGWRRSLPVGAVTIVVALMAACTDGDGGGAAASSTIGPRPEWCGVLESLDLPEDAPDVEIADAPMELQVVLEILAQNQADPEAVRDSTDVETTGAVEMLTMVEAWGHEHCGTPDPFCSLWISVNEILEAGLAEVQREVLADTLDDDLIKYAPDAHVDAVKDYLVSLYASIGRPVPSDYEEGDAEAARTTLDEWVGSHC